MFQFSTTRRFSWPNTAPTNDKPNKTSDDFVLDPIETGLRGLIQGCWSLNRLKGVMYVRIKKQRTMATMVE